MSKWMRLALAAVIAAGLAASAWFLLGRRETDPKSAWRQFPTEALWGGDRREARSPDARWIAYIEASDLWVRRADGSGARRLTTDGAPKSYPAWSPDGSFVVFYREEEMFVIALEGGAGRKIGWTLHPEGLAWSGDGKVLVFPDKESSEEPSGIYRRSISTGEKRRLTAPPDGAGGDQFPALSPDGQLLAFARSARTSGADIYVMPFLDDIARAAQARRLTFQNRPISALQWTGDGQRIVYTIRDELWSVARAGGRPDRIR